MIQTLNNSKESIKNRMIKHALNFWNIKNAEDLDPVVKLMLEALSSELYSLGNEIKDTEVRILEKIANLLAPDFLTCPNTAHAIMHANPVEPTELIRTTDHFFTTKRFALKKDDTPDTTLEVYFTPAGDLKVMDVQVAGIASAANVFVYDDSGEKKLVAHSDARSYEDSNTLWLGLQVNDKINNLQGLNFYFDWKNSATALQQLVYQLLPLSKWYLNGKEIAIAPGIDYQALVENEEDGHNIFMDYNLVSLMETDIKNYYNNRFITIAEMDAPSVLSQKQNYPQELEKWFAAADLKKLNQPLVWIKLVFPVALTQDALYDAAIFTNCFPAMNRQLNEMKYRLKGGSNIVPLKLNGIDQFLAIKNLSDEINQYRNTPYRKMEEENLGTFTLRSGGVERFDVRNAKEYISYLLELLRSESSAFSVYGYDFIATTLREMNQRIALMEQKTNSLTASATEIPHYIMVKPFEGRELMFVEYWTTLADGANYIRTGTRFQPYRSSKVKNGSVFLLTSTTAGKNRLKPEERLNAFRYGLITRNRIVTKDDIRNFCHYELGRRIHKVEITRGVALSANPKEGFYKTIDVTLTPAPQEKLGDKEWQSLCDQLLSKLKSRSGMSSHYRVMMRK